MDETKELLQAILKNQELANARITGGLDRVETELRGFKQEMHEFKQEMYEFKEEMHEFKQEMYEFKEEMHEFKQETKRHFEELHEELDEFRGEVKSEIRRLRRNQKGIENDVDQAMIEIERLKEHMGIQ